ncbi:hypothetical protein PAPHI01_0163 [Pancytospora philotis]|nr:hypothetical protein PAPHI01_0163 [Pancytospora philotis]
MRAYLFAVSLSFTALRASAAVDLSDNRSAACSGLASFLELDTSYSDHLLKQTDFPDERFYIDSVKRTMENVCARFNYNEKCDDAFLEKVLRAIYSAASDTEASLSDLVHFTSLAMHNHNVFYRFVDVNDTNNDAGRERGLLRIMSEKYYEMCTGLVSGDMRDYKTCRHLLNEFSPKSICAEFKLYLQYFKMSAGTVNHKSVIVDMGSAEGVALGSFSEMNEELNAKLERRLAIFVMLVESISRPCGYSK